MLTYGTFEPTQSGAQPTGHGVDDQSVKSTNNAKHRYERECSIGSRVFFSHIRYLVAIQKQRNFTLHDLWRLEETSTSCEVMKRLRMMFKQNNGNLFVTILQMEWPSLLASGLMVLLSIPFNLAPAFLVFVLLQTLEGDHVDTMQVVAFLASLHVATMVSTLLQCHATSLTTRSSCRTIGGCHALLLDVTLSDAFDAEHWGRIFDVYSGAVESMGLFLSNFHGTWLAFLEMGGEMVVLSRVLQVDWLIVGTAFGAIWLLILLSVLFESFLRRNSDYQRTNRWKVVNECIRSIQSVKLNAWEGRFLKRIQDARAAEQESVLRYLITLSFSHGVTQCGDDFIVGLVFALVVSQGWHFDSAVAFASIIVVRLVKSTFALLLRSVGQLAGAYQAMNALEKYFRIAMTTRNLKRSVASNAKRHDSREVLSTASASFGYNRDSAEYVLVNVSLSVKRGELVVVHSKAGEGKSTLLKALLGEVPCIQGEVCLADDCRVAYCSQEPWVQSLTVRENILFGSHYDEAKYLAVLDACALIDDLCQLPQGDETLVGSRGINLSGGQKARIALARACYADADLYVLDCPLASVDAVVQMDVFRKCIAELLRFKTVVMSTHNAEFIHSLMVDQLWEAHDSSVTVGGRDRSVAADGGSQRVQTLQASYLKSFLSAEKTLQGSSRGLVYDVRYTEALKLKLCNGQTSEAVFKHPFILKYSEEAVGPMDSIRMLVPKAKDGMWLIVVACWGAIGFEICSVLKIFWLAWWSSHDPIARSSLLQNVLVYEGFVIGAFALLLLGEGFVSWTISRAVNRVFHAMIHGLVHAPLSLYYRIRTGDVLGQLVANVDCCDYDVATALVSLGRSAMVVIGALSVLILLLGYVGLVIAFLVAFVSWQSESSNVLEQAQLLAIDVNSVDMGFRLETIEGISVVKSFGKSTVDRFVSSHGSHIDDVNSLRLSWMCLQSSEKLRMSVLHGFFMAALATLLISRDALPTRLGLSVFYVLNLHSDALEFVSSIIHVIVVFRSLNLRAFASIPPEDQMKGRSPTTSIKSDNWITHGHIKFHHAWFRYDSPSYALRDVSFTIEAGAKIGIVGRTGSGKSSLAMALLRVHELVRGRILVDDIDIRSMTLETLRSRMSIILQSPMIYRCTIREYLDPFNEFTDNALWQVIHKTGLSPIVRTLRIELHENGDNWSLGQRQLLCLARTLLRPSKIVILDEPFSSIDGESDKQLLSVLSSEMRESTVLFVTHRVDQVLTFCEKILVLKDGEVEDFGVVEELVGRSDGVFFELLENTLLTM